MSYDLVFDARQVPDLRWEAVAPWILSALIGAALLRFPRWYVRLWGNTVGFARLFGAALLLAGCSVTLIEWNTLTADRARLYDALAEPTLVTVTGPIHHFHPGDGGGHVPESFYVAGHHFEYRLSDATHAFHQTAGAGGPLREGMLVRIVDAGGFIARLEIAR